jgi:hypothetical protein
MSSANTSGNNRKIITPKWQIKRMKTMINERWQDVWDTAKSREKHNTQLYFIQYLDY